MQKELFKIYAVSRKGYKEDYDLIKEECGLDFANCEHELLNVFDRNEDALEMFKSCISDFGYFCQNPYGNCFYLLFEYCLEHALWDVCDGAEDKFICLYNRQFTSFPSHVNPDAIDVYDAD